VVAPRIDRLPSYFWYQDMEDFAEPIDDDVKKVIAGPGVYICNECVGPPDRAAVEQHER